MGIDLYRTEFPIANLHPNHLALYLLLLNVGTGLRRHLLSVVVAATDTSKMRYIILSHFSCSCYQVVCNAELYRYSNL